MKVSCGERVDVGCQPGCGWLYGGGGRIASLPGRAAAAFANLIEEDLAGAASALRRGVAIKRGCIGRSRYGRKT